LINDSSKRVAGPEGEGPRQTLVIQGSPAYSRRELESEPSRWADALLEAAAGELGDWVKQPAWRQEHRWRYARTQLGDELSHPVLLAWEGGAQLGLCGEAFNPVGGVEGAYLSGLELAGRISADSATTAS
jgi:predicted NAD/FAD-dependent oxidoreductase